MRIAHLNTYTEGGAAEAALRLHIALLQAGEQSKFISLYKGRCDLNEVYDFRKELNAINYWFTKVKNKQKNLSALKISGEAGEWFSEISSVWKAEEHSAVIEADLVHLHWISNFVNLPTFLKINKKIVWTLHDHFLFSGGFHYPPFKNYPAAERKIEEQKQIIKTLLAKHPIDLVCPSEHLKEMAEASGILSKCRFHVIKNPVDTSVFKPLSKEECRTKLNIPVKGKVLFFLSDHINYVRKGFSLLEKALSLVENEVTLIVAGRGQLPDIIGKAKIIPFGLVKNKTLLNELYNACDVLVNPSLNDISSNTIIEAMACGKPVVAFNSGGIPDLITSLNGLIAEEKTPESLANAINRSLSSTYDSTAITKKAYDEHSLKVIAQKYIAVYRKL